MLFLSVASFHLVVLDQMLVFFNLTGGAGVISGKLFPSQCNAYFFYLKCMIA